MKDLSLRDYLILEWMFVAICLFFVLARLAVRTWKHQWRFWLSEIWLGIGVLIFTELVASTTYVLVEGLNVVGNRDNVEFNKFQVSIIFLSDVVYYFPRFCLLAFYNELFPISEEWLRKCLYLVMAYNGCAFLATFLTDLFWCGLPLSKNWSTNPDDCTLFQVSGTYNITWPLSIIAEILVFALPFGMFKRLKVMPRGEKNSLIFLFGIGIINIVLSVCRFIFARQSIFTFNSAIVTSAEITSQVIVCAMPALRPLLPFISTGWTRVASVLTGRTTTVTSDDERTLHGSYSSRGGKNNNTSQLNENVAELGEWQPDDGNSHEK